MTVFEAAHGALPRYDVKYPRVFQVQHTLGERKARWKPRWM